MVVAAWDLGTPFYAYGASLGDTVLATHDADEGRPTFRSVLSKSGNRTVRVTFDPPVERDNPLIRCCRVSFGWVASMRV